MTDKKNGDERTLAEVRPQLDQSVAYERAQAQAADLAAEARETDHQSRPILDKVAKAQA